MARHRYVQKMAIAKKGTNHYNLAQNFSKMFLGGDSSYLESMVHQGAVLNYMKRSRAYESWVVPVTKSMSATSTLGVW
jgi:hypothetical protein